MALKGVFSTICNVLLIHRDDLNIGYTHILLRTITFKTVETKEIDNGRSHKHINMHYIELRTTLLDVEQITICGDRGQLVPFDGGKCLAKLHFRYSI